MTTRNDTVPDRVARDGDTDPAAPVTAPALGPVSSSSANDTDPTWLEPCPPPGDEGELDEGAASADGLLGGFAARPRVAPRTMAESSGEDAARYATVASPVRGLAPQSGAARAPAVILANTEPLPVLVPIDPRSAPATPHPPARSSELTPRAEPAPARKRSAVVTTVPGLRQRSGTRRILVAALLLAVGALLVLLALVFRDRARASTVPSATPGTSVVVASSSAPPGVSQIVAAPPTSSTSGSGSGSVASSPTPSGPSRAAPSARVTGTERGVLPLPAPSGGRVASPPSATGASGSPAKHEPPSPATPTPTPSSIPKDDGLRTF